MGRIHISHMTAVALCKANSTCYSLLAHDMLALTSIVCKSKAEGICTGLVTPRAAPAPPAQPQPNQQAAQGTSDLPRWPPHQQGVGSNPQLPAQEFLKNIYEQFRATKHLDRRAPAQMLAVRSQQTDGSHNMLHCRAASFYWNGTPIAALFRLD